MTIEFEKFPATMLRNAAVVGDTFGSVLGVPVGTLPALIFNVTVQPSGSDIFTGGSNVSWATAIATTFSKPGRHVFQVSCTDAPNIRQFEIVVWPAAALNVNGVKFNSPASAVANSARPDNERRAVLRSLAQHATVAGISATLEIATPLAPSGVNPLTLGASNSTNLIPFGGGLVQ